MAPKQAPGGRPHSGEGSVTHRRQPLKSQKSLFSVLIFALIFYFAIRYRRRSDLDMPRPIHGSTALEIFWSAVPFVIVMVMFGWGAGLYFKNSRPP